MPLVPALRNGEFVRLMTGGVWVLDGGLEGRLIEGLSQDEKKSSPGSEGVDVPSAGVDMTISLITTSSGNLCLCQPWGAFMSLGLLTLGHRPLLSS